MAILRAVLFALFSFLMLSPAMAEGQRVLLILDASGSMRGRIEGLSKMDIAKDVVAKVVSTWKPEDELGLIAYGHRQKGSCDDIQVLKEPGPLDKAAFLRAVDGLSPKGKTPLTAAVRMAAEALQYTEKKATVILVSDGIETCNQDPCSVAEELEKSGVGLTVHTVGFGLDDKGAVAQLKCLADKTGGIAVLADNAGELQDALSKTVAASEAPPEPQPPKYNFTGHVVMAPGVELSEAFSKPAWDIYKLVNGEKGPYVQTETGADVKGNIAEPGSYLLKISDGAALLLKEITVEQGKPLDLQLSLDAGVIHAVGMMDDETPATDPSVAFELRGLPNKFLDTKYGGETEFLANAGDYRLILSLGDAKVEQQVKVEAGKTQEVVMSLGAGVVTVNATFSPGGQPVLDNTAVEVRKGEADLEGKHDWINTQYGPKTTFKLRAGSYQLIASQDYAVGETMIEVKPGQAVSVDLSVNGGYLAVSAPGAASYDVYGAKDLSGKRKWISTDYTPQLNKAYNAGTWHVVAKDEAGNPIAEKDFEVKAGERTEGSIP